ncbi:hypothetical protein [Streptomyces phytophilus]|uniref:hypothetical protein n=1 Tax=Streptomyces phytophilus TaxID=722715 RepID=UPI0015F07CB5|nr:hypothetical protein [Streptomyces phytophilus]
MPPTTRQATSRKPSAPRAIPRSEPAEDTDDDYPDAAEAQEIEAEGHYVTALLAGEEIRIVPPGAWRQSWQTALAEGKFNVFAEHVVHPDDLDTYFDIDPTNDEFEAFVADAAGQAGESLGKSRGRAGRSRRTRRR